MSAGEIVTPAARLAELERFVVDALGHRRAMRNGNPDKRAYWQHRVDQAQESIDHVHELEKIVAVLGIDAGMAALVVETLNAEAKARRQAARTATEP